MTDMSKVFSVARQTIGVLSFIVAVAQIVEYGVELSKKIKKPKKVKGFVNASVSN